MCEKVKIIKFEDKELRKGLADLWQKLQDLNDRTKKHTLEIRELRKLISS